MVKTEKNYVVFETTLIIIMKLKGVISLDLLQDNISMWTRRCINRYLIISAVILTVSNSWKTE